MLTDRQHIIQKVKAEIAVSSDESHREKSEQVKKAVEDAIRNLEPVLDEISCESLIRIDSLSVEFTLSSVDYDQLGKKIESEIKEKIHESLKDQSGNTYPTFKVNSENISADKGYREILSIFLKTGRLPWWADERALDEAEQWLMNLSSDEWQTFIKPLGQDPEVIARLIRQLSPSVVQEVVRKTVDMQSGGEQLIKLQNEILQFMQSLNESEAVYQESRRDLFSRMLIGSLAGLHPDKLSDDLLISVLNRMRKTDGARTDSQQLLNKFRQWFKRSEQPEAEFWIYRLGNLSDKQTVLGEELELTQQSADSKSDSFASDKPEEKEGVMAKNAGVVILHPFLESLFKNLGYVENGEFLNEAARERGVCLVHYIATGQEEFPEYELPLPKFLCAWPPDVPVNRYLSLTESEKEECNSVLLSCIQHWDAIKRTSIDGLRENFLHRDGVLKRDEFGWSLYIEEKTIDLMLDKLPWNLSIIKLNWMDEMLTVHRY